MNPSQTKLKRNREFFSVVKANINRIVLLVVPDDDLLKNIHLILMGQF